MSIRKAALSLSDFNKVITEFPETPLKQDLQFHVEKITHSLICERVKRNQRRQKPAQFKLKPTQRINKK